MLPNNLTVYRLSCNKPVDKATRVATLQVECHCSNLRNIRQQRIYYAESWIEFDIFPFRIVGQVVCRFVSARVVFLQPIDCVDTAFKRTKVLNCHLHCCGKFPIAKAESFFIFYLNSNQIRHNFSSASVAVP